MQDPITAIVQFLKNDAGISSLAGTRVYGIELPKAEAVTQARKVIVCSAAGGGSAADYVKVNNFRIDFFCYGETPYEALNLLLTLHSVVKQMERKVVLNTMLYSAIQSGGPTTFRDPDTGWPVAIETWMVSVCETAIN